MKRIFIFAAIAALAISCTGNKEARVMARFVPERYDDFIFENNLIAGRFYGEALESCGNGQITSPGIDVWVKTPGALVANQRYVDELEHGKTYHINWGNGKDCYKVARSLGAGASSPIINGQPALPATNFRSHEILENTPEKVVFVLNYPEWEQDGVTVSLSKKITVTPDTYFVKAEDTYTFSGDSLTVAAGVNRHIAQNILYAEKFENDRYAIWEGASDQSIEEDPDSRVGVAVVVPEATFNAVTEDGGHALVGKTLKQGEVFTYWFGSCWNGGDIKTAEEWIKLVSDFKE